MRKEIKKLIKEYNSVEISFDYIWKDDNLLINLLKKNNIKLKEPEYDDYYYGGRMFNKNELIKFFECLENKGIEYEVEYYDEKRRFLKITFKPRYVRLKKDYYYNKYNDEELLLRCSSLGIRCTHGLNFFTIFLKNKNVKKIIDKVEDSWEMGSDVWREYTYNEKTKEVKFKTIINGYEEDVRSYPIKELTKNKSYEY